MALFEQFCPAGRLQGGLRGVKNDQLHPESNHENWAGEARQATAPTGLRHSAQGCRVERGYLGCRWRKETTLNGLCPVAEIDWNPFRVPGFFGALPKVGVASLRQPWAERRNPVGIGRRVTRLALSLNFSSAGFVRTRNYLHFDRQFFKMRFQLGGDRIGI